MKVVLDLDHTLCQEDVENWIEEVIMPSTPCVKGYSFVEHRCGKCHISKNNEREELIDKACDFLSRAIDEWNDKERHRTFYLDKEGCLRNFRKAMED